MPKPIQPADIHAVVLAGGRAERMGGQDKGLLRLEGRALIEYVLDRLAPQVGAIAISANRNLERYAAFGYPIFPDDIPDWPGPLAGLAAAFSRTDAPWVLTAPCDVPRLPPNLAARLVEITISSGAPIASVRVGDRVEAAFMLASRRLAPDLKAFLAKGERRVQSWQERHRRALADFSDQPEAFANINTPEQLARLQRGWGIT